MCCMQCEHPLVMLALAIAVIMNSMLCCAVLCCAVLCCADGAQLYNKAAM